MLQGHGRIPSPRPLNALQRYHYNFATLRVLSLYLPELRSSCCDLETCSLMTVTIIKLNRHPVNTFDSEEDIVVVVFVEADVYIMLWVHSCQQLTNDLRLCFRVDHNKMAAIIVTLLPGLAPCLYGPVVLIQANSWVQAVPVYTVYVGSTGSYHNGRHQHERPHGAEVSLSR